MDGVSAWVHTFFYCSHQITCSASLLYSTDFSSMIIGFYHRVDVIPTLMVFHWVLFKLVMSEWMKWKKRLEIFKRFACNRRIQKICRYLFNGHQIKLVIIKLNKIVFAYACWVRFVCECLNRRRSESKLLNALMLVSLISNTTVQVFYTQKTYHFNYTPKKKNLLPIYSTNKIRSKKKT